MLTLFENYRHYSDVFVRMQRDHFVVAVDKDLGSSLATIIP